MEKCALCAGSYCFLNCYIVSTDRWVMKFPRRLKSHKATFMERQHTHIIRRQMEAVTSPKVAQIISRLRTLKKN